MKKIKVGFTCSWGRTSESLYESYRQYAPGGSGCWNHLQGVPTVEESDVVFMMEGPGRCTPDMIDKLKSKRLFVIRHEPPDVKPSHLLGLNAVPLELRAQTTLVDYETQPIWYFSKWEMALSHTHEDFSNMKFFEKKEKLSCLVSAKNFIPGHRKRQNFIEKFIRDEKNLLTLFGRNKIDYSNHRGSLSGEEKYLAYQDFEYTLCFENSWIPNYLSDKLFDALLMWSMPIYWGAPNVANYLPEESFHMLSCGLDGADIEKIKHICESRPTEKNIKGMKEARRLILEKYSLWPSLQHVLENY